MDDLESEIAGALTSSAITSSELARLIEQVITAAAAADEAAAQERARALDPAVVVDTQAVSAAIVAAELRRDRLNAALPRLQTRCAKVDAAERYARWILDYDKVRGQRDALAAELQALYAPLVVKLVSLLERIESIEDAVKSINASKPMEAEAANGDGRWLDPVETVARGGGRLNETLIARDLRLPHWDAADGLAWPPYRPMLPFQLSELEAQRVRQQHDEVRQRAQAIAEAVERQLTAAE